MHAAQMQTVVTPVVATCQTDAGGVGCINTIPFPPMPFDAGQNGAQTVDYELYDVVAQKDGGIGAGSVKYHGIVRSKLHLCQTILAPTAVQAFTYADAGADAAMISSVAINSTCNDAGPCACSIADKAGIGLGRILDHTTYATFHAAQ